MADTEATPGDTGNDSVEELEHRVHEAMEAAHGNMKVAAAILDVSVDDLKTCIRNRPSLNERWFAPTGSSRQMPPGEAAVIHRPHKPDRELAAAIAKEDAAVRKGLEAMGISGDALKLATSFQKFQRQHYKTALEILGGGITKQFLDVMAEVQKISITLTVEARDLPPERERMLREDRARLLAVMNAFYDRANKAALTQAVIKHKLSSNGKGSSPSKPGFSPLVMQVQGNVSMTVPPEEGGPNGNGDGTGD